MKKLLLTSIAMMGCATVPREVLTSQIEPFKKLGIPTKFETYRTKRFTKKLVETNGNLIGVKDYFLDKDKILL